MMTITNGPRQSVTTDDDDERRPGYCYYCAGVCHVSSSDRHVCNVAIGILQNSTFGGDDDGDNDDANDGMSTMMSTMTSTMTVDDVDDDDDNDDDVDHYQRSTTVGIVSP